jgi:hypothetical protein
MYKDVITFESNRDIVVAIRFRKQKENSIIVRFDVVSAIDHFDGNGAYDLISPSGDFVESFEEALQLASGTVFMSDNPILLARGEATNYTVKLGDNLFFKNEFEALIRIISNEVKENGRKILFDEDLNEEYEFRSEEIGSE